MIDMPDMWVMLPESLAKMRLEYLAYIEGQKEYRDHIETMADARSPFVFDIAKAPQSYFIDGNIAVMQIEGVIFPKGDFFTALFGGSTLDVMRRDFKALVEDPNIDAIVLDINSPGGSAFGVIEFSNMVFEAREIKSVYAISGTMMTSAAAIIGAAAGKGNVAITDESVLTGSLAVVRDHMDVSRMMERIGIKITHITSGKFKRIDTGSAPLTEEGREVMQGEVNHVDAAMMEAVARFRATSIEDVRENMAQGKTFVGSQGIEAGLVDGIISPEDFLNRVEANLNLKFRNN